MTENSFAIARNVYSKCTPGTREQLLAMRNSNLVINLCAQAEAGNDNAKSRLPVWTPSCAEFKNGIRKVKHALKPTGRIMLDFDQKGHSKEILEACMRLKNAGTWDILLVEESARRGTHVLITCPKGMSAQQIQQEFSKAVGFEADKSLKDIARCIYIVPQDHVLYEDERLYEMPSEANLPITPLAPQTASAVDTQPHLQTPAPAFCSPAEPNEMHRKIFELATQKARLNLSTLDMPGSRHNNLLAILSIGITRLIPQPELTGLVSEYFPQYFANEDDCSQLINDYYQKYTNCNAPMSRSLRDIVAQCQLMKHIDNDESETANMLVLPPMPNRLPPLIELLTSKVDDIYKPTVAHAVFPSLGAHLLNVTFPYIDNVDHEATLMNVLMAHTGSGKSCINQPINAIMEDIRTRDEISMGIERDWKEKMSVKGANAKGIKRPTDIIIQEIDPDITSQALLIRMREAQGRFLFTQMNELELLDGLKTNAKSINHFQIICLAFDPDNQYGHTRAAFNSITERVKIRFNWNASTTIGKARKYFRDVLTDGPISRINFCTIPTRPIGAPMPKYGDYDFQFKEELRPYIQHLNSAIGRIYCPEAHLMVKNMLEEDRKIAIINNDRTYENLSFRANVIAFLKAMVLYVAHGQKWSDEIEEFAMWSKRYDMSVKMYYFAHEIDMAENEIGEVKKHRCASPIMAELNDTFTLAELEAACEKCKSVTPSVQLIRVWRNRKLIQDTDTPHTYIKRH